MHAPEGSKPWVAVTALAEVARLVRFVNVALGAWLVASPWLIGAGFAEAGAWNAIVVGMLVIGLSLPCGRRSREHYGYWDAYIA